VPPTARIALALVAVVAAVAAATGCGAGDVGTADGTGPAPALTAAPLSDRQAERLAHLFADNHRRGGAHFEARLTTPDGAAVAVEGAVDWRQRRGLATVSGSGFAGGIDEVLWDPATVLERRPALDAELAAAGHPGARWVARPLYPDGQPLDYVLALVTGLSSPHVDDPAAIARTPGSGLVRTETVRGVDTEVLRFGGHNLYWLAVDDGRLVAFATTDDPATHRVHLDVVDHAEVEVPNPPRHEVVRINDVAEAYQRVVGSPSPERGTP
jgi:hypothetical protein